MATTPLPAGWKARHVSGKGGCYSVAIYDAAKACIGTYSFAGFTAAPTGRWVSAGLTFSTEREARAFVIGRTA